MDFVSHIKEYTLTVFEDCVLRRTYGPEKDEVI